MLAVRHCGRSAWCGDPLLRTMLASMGSTPTPEEVAALRRKLAQALRHNETLNAELAVTAVELKTLCGELKLVRTKRDLLQKQLNRLQAPAVRGQERARRQRPAN